jgi:hypothetical protein
MSNVQNASPLIFQSRRWPFVFREVGRDLVVLSVQLQSAWKGLGPRELNLDSSVEFSVPDHEAVHSPSVPVELLQDRFTLGTQSIPPPKKRELHPKEDVPLMSTPYVGILSNSLKEATCTTQLPS